MSKSKVFRPRFRDSLGSGAICFGLLGVNLDPLLHKTTSQRNLDVGRRKIVNLVSGTLPVKRILVKITFIESLVKVSFVLRALRFAVDSVLRSVAFLQDDKSDSGVRDDSSGSMLEETGSERPSRFHECQPHHHEPHLWGHLARPTQ